MINMVVVMKIMMYNKKPITYKSTHSLDSKEENVIIVLSILKDSGVNMHAHPIKLILSK